MPFHGLASMQWHIKPQTLAPSCRQKAELSLVMASLQSSSTFFILMLSRNLDFYLTSCSSTKKAEGFPMHRTKCSFPLPGKPLSGLLSIMMPRFCFAMFFPWDEGKLERVCGECRLWLSGNGIEVLHPFLLECRKNETGSCCSWPLVLHSFS